MSTRVESHAVRGLPTGDLEVQPPWADLARRLQKAERQSRWLKYALLIMAPLLIYVFVGQELPKRFVQREPLMDGNRVQLFDEIGNARMNMRLNSGAPLMQLIDENGTPRLILGLRYDDSPFISLANIRGQTRASLQMGADDRPALRMFDDDGKPSFSAD